MSKHTNVYAPSGKRTRVRKVFRHWYARMLVQRQDDYYNLRYFNVPPANIRTMYRSSSFYACPRCYTRTNFEDKTDLLKRYNFIGVLGERDWSELWRCPVCCKKYIIQNGEG